MARYRKVDMYDARDTSFKVAITASLPVLYRVLGRPSRVGGDKVTREWDLRGPKGVVTLYDWESTSEYREDLPTPGEFWSQRWAVLNVGAKTMAAANDFVLWLGNKKAVRSVYKANARRKRIKWTPTEYGAVRGMGDSGAIYRISKIGDSPVRKVTVRGPSRGRFEVLADFAANLKEAKLFAEGEEEELLGLR